MLLHLVSIIVDEHHTRWILLLLLLLAAGSPCILLLLLLLCAAVWWQHVFVLQYPHHCYEYIIQAVAGRLLGTTPQQTTANDSATLRRGVTHGYTGQQPATHNKKLQQALRPQVVGFCEVLACRGHALQRIDGIRGQQAV
jgi:hypothetical protein